MKSEIPKNGLKWRIVLFVNGFKVYKKKITYLGLKTNESSLKIMDATHDYFKFQPALVK
jgi:hypothetical protein